MLDALRYVIRVSASEYAKYYFHLRSMMARLGFHGNETNIIAPLDIANARKLELATEKYLESKRSKIPRSRSVDASMDSMAEGSRRAGHACEEHHALVSFEQIVHAEHMDADGQTHLSAHGKDLARQKRRAERAEMKAGHK